MSGRTPQRATKDEDATRAERRVLDRRRQPAPSNPLDDVLALQEAAGNQAVNGLLADGHGQVPPIVGEVLRGGGGQPLDPATRSFMESRFGEDFSQVRVHTGARAAESARAVDAAAYTVGRDVVFGAGHYVPKRSDGRQLLAHELVHVVQQARADRWQTCMVNSPTDAFEADAQRAAATVSEGWSTQIAVTGTPPVIQRQERSRKEWRPPQPTEKTGMTVIARRPARYAGITRPEQAIVRERTDRLLLAHTPTSRLIEIARDKHIYLTEGSIDLGEQARSEIATTLFAIKDIIDKRIRAAPLGPDGRPSVEGLIWPPGDPLAGFSEAIFPFHSSELWATYLREPPRAKPRQRRRIPPAPSVTMIEEEPTAIWGEEIPISSPTKMDLEDGERVLKWMVDLAHIEASDFAHIDHSAFTAALKAAKIYELGPHLLSEIFTPEGMSHLSWLDVPGAETIAEVGGPPVLLAVSQVLVLEEIGEANEWKEIGDRRRRYYKMVAEAVASELDWDYKPPIPSNPLLQHVVERWKRSVQARYPSERRHLRSKLATMVAATSSRSIEDLKSYLNGPYYYSAMMAALDTQENLTR